MHQDIYETMNNVASRHWWFVVRRQIVAQAVRHLDFPKGIRILEAGCGPGSNLGMLRQFGEVSAFELDEKACKMAEAHQIGDVRVGFLPSRIPFEPGTFDLVVALDVLEHIQEDRASLSALRSMLKPGGTLLLTVPAFNFLWSDHDEAHHHWRRYKKAELIEKVSSAGFEHVRSTYFNTFLFPIVAGLRLTRNFLNWHGTNDIDMPSPITNRILQFIFGLEKLWLSKASFPFGVSVLAIARRR